MYLADLRAVLVPSKERKKNDQVKKIMMMVGVMRMKLMVMAMTMTMIQKMELTAVLCEKEPSNLLGTYVYDFMALATDRFWTLVHNERQDLAETCNKRQFLNAVKGAGAQGVGAKNLIGKSCERSELATVVIPTSTDRV